MFLKVSLLLLLIGSSQCFNTGAGTTACETMTPSHLPNHPQTSDIPVSVSASSSTVAQGENLTFVIQSAPGFSFRGFLLQVRTLQSSAQVVGTFSPNAETRNVLCFTLPTNSVATHTNSGLKSRVEIQWTAPTDFTGIVNVQ